jgi:hypothetical protein
MGSELAYKAYMRRLPATDREVVGGATEKKQPAGNWAETHLSTDSRQSFGSQQVKPRHQPRGRNIYSVSGQFKISQEKLAELTIDETKILNEIQSVYPNYIPMLVIISKWFDYDRELSSEMGKSHLDFFLAKLWEKQINTGTDAERIWTNGLDLLINLFDEKGGLIKKQFRYYLDKSHAFREYISGPHITHIWQWEMRLADELYFLTICGKYERVQQKIEDEGITDTDDVAFYLSKQLQKNNKLNKVAMSSEGQHLLTYLYDTLSSGSYDANESQLAYEILQAKYYGFSMHNPDPEQEVYQPNIKTFPHRHSGFTVSNPAVFSVWRSRPGFIKIQMNPGVYASERYLEEVHSINFNCSGKEALELPEDERIKIIDYDKGGLIINARAFELLEISNKDVTHTFEKISEVAGLAMLPFMLGPGVAAESWEALSLAAKMARILQGVDFAATVFGTITTVLLEHRGWFIREYESGEKIVNIIEIIDAAIKFYGFIRMATQMPRVVNDFQKAAQNWRAEVRERKAILQSLEKDKIEAINNFDNSLEKLEKGILDVKAANDNKELLPGEIGANKSVPTGNVYSIEDRIGTGGSYPGLPPGSRSIPTLPVPKPKVEPPHPPPSAPAQQVPRAEENQLLAVGTTDSSPLNVKKDRFPQKKADKAQVIVGMAKRPASGGNSPIEPTKVAKGRAEDPIPSICGSKDKSLPDVVRNVDRLPEPFPIPEHGLANHEEHRLLNFFRQHRGEYPPDIQKIIDDIPDGLAKTPLRHRLNKLNRAILDKHTAEANLRSGKANLPEEERPFFTSQRANANEGNILSSLTTDQKQLSLTGRLKSGGVAEFDSVAIHSRVITETKLSLFRLVGKSHDGKRRYRLIPVEDIRDQMMRQANFANDWGFIVKWEIWDYESYLQANKAWEMLRENHSNLAELIKVIFF